MEQEHGQGALGPRPAQTSGQALSGWFDSLTSGPRLAVDPRPIHDEVDHLAHGLDATGSPVTISKRYATNLLRCPTMAVHERSHPPAGTEEHLIEGRLAEHGMVLHLGSKPMRDLDTFIRSVTAYAAAHGETCPPADDPVWEYAHDTVCRFATSAGDGPWEPGPFVFQEDIIVLLGGTLDRPAVVLRGRGDVSIGGRGPTSFLRAILELKSTGTPDIDDELGWYTILVALRDGFAPTHAALWARGERGAKPAGELTVVPVDAPLIRDATLRLLDVVAAASDVARGDIETIPGGWCTFCPLRDTCPKHTSGEEHP